MNGGLSINVEDLLWAWSMYSKEGNISLDYSPYIHAVIDGGLYRPNAAPGKG